MAKLISPDAIVSKKAKLEHPVRVYAFAGVQSGAQIGRYTFVNRHAFVSGGATIGRYCSISRAVEVGVTEHPMNMLSSHPFQYSKTHFTDISEYSGFPRDYTLEPLKTLLGHDVLVGAKGIIKGGVSIGTGAMIEPNSYVASDVPAYAVVSGSPARVTHYRFPEPVIARLLASNWWDLTPADLAGVAFDDIDRALDQIADVFHLKTQEDTATHDPDTDTDVTDDAMVQALQHSLYEMNMPDIVIDLVMSNAATIAKTFDPLNAGDQEILNNKLAYLIDFMAERNAERLSVNEKNHISSLFRQKA